MAGKLDELETRGYMILPRVLNQSEVASLREAVNLTLDERGLSKAGGSVLPNAAAEAPELSWIFCHDKIVKAVREATGWDKMVFTMEADLHRNYVGSAWHKDSGEQVMDDGYFGRNCFDTDECRVFKVALYLQDQASKKEVLHVRPGSTHQRDLNVGDDTPVFTKAGDAVLFDVRLTHRGVQWGAADYATLGLATLRSPKNRRSVLVDYRRALLGLRRRPDRIAVYFAFGIPNEDSERFAKRNMRRQLAQIGSSAAQLPGHLIAAFEEANISTVDLA